MPVNAGEPLMHIFPDMHEGGEAIATLTAPADTGPDPLSFEEFFLQHRVPLFRAVWLIVRNRQEAEEIMQEAFVRVLERWDRVSTHPDPGGYLYRTAINEFRSRRRRAAKTLRRVVRADRHDDELEAIEQRDAVIAALAPLTPRQRAAVVLTDVLGLSSEEAARALGVRPSTVRVLAGRGRETLRREMNRDG
jgi:RNA polymerase sigma factor (sigma-70 family)